MIGEANSVQYGESSPSPRRQILAAELERISDIFPGEHVRKQSVGLKDDPDITEAWRNPDRVFAGNLHSTAQRLYDGIGAVKSTWLSYELDA